MKILAMIHGRSPSGIHPPSLGRTLPPATPIPSRVWRFSTCAGALRTLRPRAASTTRPLRWKATQLAAVRPAAKTTAAGAPCSIARRDRPRLRDAWALRSVQPARAPNPDRALGARPAKKAARNVKGQVTLNMGAPKWPPNPPAFGAPRQKPWRSSKPPRRSRGAPRLRQLVRGESAAQRVLGDHARLDELHEVVRPARLPANARELPSAERLAADAGAGGGAVDIEVADAKRLPRACQPHRAPGEDAPRQRVVQACRDRQRLLERRGRHAGEH